MKILEMEAELLSRARQDKMDEEKDQTVEKAVWANACHALWSPKGDKR